MTDITNHLQTITKNIEAAACKANRDPHTVHLLAVSKTRPPEDILDAAEAGQRAFGENYEQEAVSKIESIRQSRPDLELEWHFIGPIQSNKTRSIAEHFDWVHSVDREKIARRLSEQRPENLPPLNVCLQVNISKEKTKSGVLPEEVSCFGKSGFGDADLRLRGLWLPGTGKRSSKTARAFFCNENPVRPAGSVRIRSGYLVHGHVGRYGNCHTGRRDNRAYRHGHLWQTELSGQTVNGQIF